MLVRRVLTAVACLLVIVPVVWFGPPWFSLFIGGAAVVGTFEFHRLVISKNVARPLLYFAPAWSLGLTLSPYYQDILPVVITLPIVISLGWLLLTRSSRDKAFHSWAWTIAGVFYIGWLLSYWLQLDALSNGRAWVYLALFTTFASDSSAFLVGRNWGRHRLDPGISPGKTWEGVIGGFIGAVLGAIIIMRIVGLFSSLFLPIWQVVIFGLLVSLLAQFGDLVESLFKRNMGVRSSSNLLPGHGGALDRLDSLIFVGVGAYYYAAWLVM